MAPTWAVPGLFRHCVTFNFFVSNWVYSFCASQQLNLSLILLYVSLLSHHAPFLNKRMSLRPAQVS